MTTEFDSLKVLLSCIRENGQFSDLTVRCESSSFQVHRCIVCPQSPFFDKAANSEFQEANSHVIAICDDPFIASKMFDFLYCADYDDSPETMDDITLGGSIAVSDETRFLRESSSEDDVLPYQWKCAQINVQTYIIADKYMIDGLKDISKRKFKSNMEKEWSDTGFTAVIGDVYGSHCPPRSDLREILSEFALRHLATLRQFQKFHDIRKGFPEFGYELSTAMMHRVVELEKSLCDNRFVIQSTPKLVPTLSTSHRPLALRCNMCRKTFNSRTSLRQHDVASHDWCTDCKRSFRTTQKAQAHRIQTHGGF